MRRYFGSDQPSQPILRAVAGIVFVIFLIFGAALLMTDPRTHFLGALALLPLLLCPLMHLLMKHRRHKHAKLQRAKLFSQ
jgi:hypothetical protein